MNFSKQIKNEIIDSKLSDKALALFVLGGIVKSNSKLTLGKSKKLIIECDDLKFFEFVNKLLEILYDCSADLFLSDDSNFKKRDKYEIVIKGNTAKKVLTDCQVIVYENGLQNIIGGIDKDLFDNTKKIIAFVKGVFLNVGSSNIILKSQNSITNSSGYHLEFSFFNEILADDFAFLLSQLDIDTKKIIRKNQFVVYIKALDTISDLLALMGAKKSVLDLANESAYRSVKNTVNRQTNCLNANIDKIVIAGVKQVNAINEINSTLGIENLPVDLQEVANLRLANVEESLDNLVKLSLNKYTKSSLNRRLNKLLKIAEELK